MQHGCYNSLLIWKGTSRNLFCVYIIACFQYGKVLRKNVITLYGRHIGEIFFVLSELMTYLFGLNQMV